MRFFVPLSNDPRHAEQRYRELRENVSGRTGPLAERRVYRLQFVSQGKRQTLAVGDSFHALGGQPVLAIFASEQGSAYYVCTGAQGSSEAREPFVVSKEADPVAEEFTQSA